MGLTKVSVLRLKEKQEEHRTLQTLINIPLRSMLINAGVPLKKRLATVSKRKVTVK